VRQIQLLIAHLGCNLVGSWYDRIVQALVVLEFPLQDSEHASSVDQVVVVVQQAVQDTGPVVGHGFAVLGAIVGLVAAAAVVNIVAVQGGHVHENKYMQVVAWLRLLYSTRKVSALEAARL
jgi:hypothetical protein